MSLYDTGIKMTNGFSVAAKKPADLKFLADTISDRDNYVTGNLSYEGMIVYVKETKKTYQLIDDIWKEFGFNSEDFEGSVYDGLDSDSAVLALSARQGKVLDTKITTHESDNTKHITAEERQQWNAITDITTVTQDKNGLMTAEDKKKLDGIEANANNYTHPDSHPADMIDEDETHRFVSDSEKSTWNAKADSKLVTQSDNGLMRSTDKVKLDGIEEGANNYTHPENHDASMINQDETHRFVTDEQINSWNSKPGSINIATPTTNGLMSAEDKKKLDTVEEGANKYTHPDSHPADFIVQDTTHRFVTDEQINNWNSKPGSVNIATPENDGLMSSVDKKKLDTIEEGANKYIHPENHEATMITEDETHRFVTDTEKSTWNAKASTAIATTSKSGLMSAEDKKKLDGIEEGATNNKSLASQTENGLMSAKDKIKLDSIASNANNYVHPDSHPATMIDEDETHRFVTDTEKSTWNAKADAIKAEANTKDGLMSKEDKAKLDGIEANANNYTHPEKHDATIINQDSTHRFVTDEQINSWNSKPGSVNNATPDTDGLMSAEDKKKLDTIEEGANKYTHPEFHPATMITEDSTHRFITDTERSNWNALIEQIEQLRTQYSEMLDKLKTAVFLE